MSVDFFLWLSVKTWQPLYEPGAKRTFLSGGAGVAKWGTQRSSNVESFFRAVSKVAAGSDPSDA